MPNHTRRRAAGDAGCQPSPPGVAVRALFVGLSLAMFSTGIPAQSGVLLGLDTGQGYRTLWIATDGDSAVLLASGPDLLVPRADGFWRVGLVKLDEYTSRIAASPGSRWSAAVDSLRATHVTPTEDCLQASGEGVVFLGPTHLEALGSYYSEGCATGTRGGQGFAIVPLDDIRPLVGQRLDLDPERTLILEGALRAAPDSARRDLALAHPDATAEERRGWEFCDFDASWSIRRRPGRWEVFVVATGPEEPYYLQDRCPGYGFSLAMTLPETITGHDDLFPSLYEISLALPGVRDAVSSPRRDLVVAVTGDSLYAARVEDGRIRRPALALPMRGAIVMAQWALGRHVARWTDEVRPRLGAASTAEGTTTTSGHDGSIVTRVLRLEADGTRRQTGDVVLVGQPVLIGLDRASSGAVASVDEIRIDDRRFATVPDTAGDGLRFDRLLRPAFVPDRVGRYRVTVGRGGREAERFGAHTFFAIAATEGNDEIISGRPPDVTLDIPDGATGVPVDHLIQLDFSEPVRRVAGRIGLERGPSEWVPMRIAAVGITGDGGVRVYPNLDAAEPDALIRSVTLIPRDPLKSGTRYRVIIQRGIVDADTTAAGGRDPHLLTNPYRTIDFETARPGPDPGGVARSEPSPTTSPRTLAHRPRSRVPAGGRSENR